MAAGIPEQPFIDYYFGPYRFDGRLRRLYKDGELIVLTPKAADMLVALVERAGRVVEKDELLRVYLPNERFARCTSHLTPSSPTAAIGVTTNGTTTWPSGR